MSKDKETNDGDVREIGTDLNRFAMKVFNPEVGQGRILNGILYFEISKHLIIQSAILTFSGNNMIKVKGKKETTSNTVRYFVKA